MFQRLKQIVASVITDLRGDITCDLQTIDVWDDDGEVMTTYEIYPYANGKQVGYMDFIVHEFQDNVEENYIEIISIQIDKEYQGFGISTVTYKTFSELYKRKYDGYPLERLFQNPVAEYSFRSAVNNGFVDSTLLDNSRIKRDYKTEDKQKQWNDLNQKLPSNVKGPEARVGKYMPNIKTAAEVVADIRNLNFDQSTENWGEKRDFRKVLASTGVVDARHLTFEVNSRSSQYIKDLVSEDIDAYANGKQAGYLTFSIYENEQMLEIDAIEIEDEYQNLGIGTALYREFGKLYQQKYNGWTVKRFFANPVAEYSFKKAISLGWVPESAMTEEKTTRNHTTENDKLWQDLRGKLPENLQDPDKWASKKDFRKITASNLVDLRGMTVHTEFVKDEEKDDKFYYLYVANYKISALIGEEEIGHLDFSEIRTRADGKDDNFLHISKVNTKLKYKKLGAEVALYKEFGLNYDQNFADWEVELKLNKEDQESFSKAIQLGYISDKTFTESHLNGEFGEGFHKLWNEKLGPKLQKAGRYDLRRVVKSMIEKTSLILDLRKQNRPLSDNMTIMKNTNVIDMRTKRFAKNVADMRGTKSITLNNYHKETRIASVGSLKDLRRTIGASAIKELRRLI